jgi:hypothetical protein
MDNNNKERKRKRIVILDMKRNPIIDTYFENEAEFDLIHSSALSYIDLCFF